MMVVLEYAVYKVTTMLGICTHVGKTAHRYLTASLFPAVVGKSCSQLLGGEAPEGVRKVFWQVTKPGLQSEHAQNESQKVTLRNGC